MGREISKRDFTRAYSVFPSSIARFPIWTYTTSYGGAFGPHWSNINKFDAWLRFRQEACKEIASRVCNSLTSSSSNSDLEIQLRVQHSLEMLNWDAFQSLATEPRDLLEIPDALVTCFRDQISFETCEFIQDTIKNFCDGDPSESLKAGQVLVEIMNR